MNGDQQPDPTPKGAKRAVNKLLVDVEEDLHDYKGGCLFVTNDNSTELLKLQQRTDLYCTEDRIIVDQFKIPNLLGGGVG